MVWPEFQDVPGAEGRVSGDPQVRQWYVDSWSGGEGEDLWVSGKFDVSTNVRPKPTGDGLVLGAYRELTVDDNGTPATFTSALRFGTGLGKFWAADLTHVHEWDPVNDDWEETGTAYVGGVGGDPSSIVDAMDGTNLLISIDDDIVKVDPGGANSNLESGVSPDPVMVNFGGLVYALVGDDLYTVDATTGLSVTPVSDLSGQSVSYLSLPSRIYTARRLAVSDKGPIWIQRLDSGQSYVWEYNEANDTTTRIGKLPDRWAFPYSIFWAFGFVFVGYRNASLHTEPGEAHIYFQRGQQQGATAEVRGVGGTSTDEPVLIAGTIGDDLLFSYDKAIWAYNLSAGGISQVAVSATTLSQKIKDALTYGKDIFIADVDDAAKCERFVTDEYSTDTATLESGRFDFGYLGITKILLQVRIVTDPLPANTAITLKQAANGGTFTTVTGTHDTDGATSYTWTVSNSTASVTGEDFELQFGLSSTVKTSTPTIRSVTTRVIAAQKQREWFVSIDAGTRITGEEGRSPRSANVLADMRTLAEISEIVKFTNPWDGEEHTAPVDYDVVVEQVQLVEAEPDGEPEVRFKLRESVYV